MEINHKGDHVLVVCPNPSVDIYAWVDEFVIGSSNRIIKEERYPGGKGVHVAMALSELGIDVLLLGFWGSVTGRWIKDQCTKYYPKIKCIGPELDTWSRSCYTFKSATDFDDSELLSAGPEVTQEDCDDLLYYLVKHLPKAKALALSGSWPQGARENGYEQMVKWANKLSIPTFIDSAGVQFKNALNENPYCIHLNRKEALSYTGTETLEDAQKQISQYCKVSAITDGEKGLYFNIGDNTLHGLSKVEEVYSTIGSGDCLLAGIIAGYVMQKTNEQIANLGAACGAANCVRPELGLMHKADVERFLDEIG